MCVNSCFYISIYLSNPQGGWNGEQMPGAGEGTSLEVGTVLWVQSFPALEQGGEKLCYFWERWFCYCFSNRGFEKRKKPRLPASCIYLLLRPVVAVCWKWWICAPLLSQQNPVPLGWWSGLASARADCATCALNLFPVAVPRAHKAAVLQASSWMHGAKEEFLSLQGVFGRICLSQSQSLPDPHGWRYGDCLEQGELTVSLLGFA